jgi:hypothetical protein
MPEPEHGTRRRYQLGCRCSPCVRANTAYQRVWRAGLCGTPNDRRTGPAAYELRPRSVVEAVPPR